MEVTKVNNNRPIRRSSPSAQSPAPKCHIPDAVLPVMAYVPVQVLGDVYSECQALHSGTLFPALDKPFSGKGCR